MGTWMSSSLDACMGVQVREHGNRDAECVCECAGTMSPCSRCVCVCVARTCVPRAAVKVEPRS